MCNGGVSVGTSGAGEEVGEFGGNAGVSVFKRDGERAVAVGTSVKRGLEIGIGGLAVSCAPWAYGDAQLARANSTMRSPTRR